MRLDGTTRVTTMDIEIQIRTGKRRTLDSGAVKWDDYKDSIHLVTYKVDEASAIRESLIQARRMLSDLFGLNSMRGEDA